MFYLVETQWLRYTTNESAASVFLSRCDICTQPKTRHDIGFIFVIP